MKHSLIVAVGFVCRISHRKVGSALPQLDSLYVAENEVGKCDTVFYKPRLKNLLAPSLQVLPYCLHRCATFELCVTQFEIDIGDLFRCNKCILVGVLAFASDILGRVPRREAHFNYLQLFLCRFTILVMGFRVGGSVSMYVYVNLSKPAIGVGIVSQSHQKLAPIALRMVLLLEAFILAFSHLITDNCIAAEGL